MAEKAKARRPPAKNVDWERIERLYAAGQLSVHEIARNHEISEGTIRARAKKLGWTRDLDVQVKLRTKQKLLRETLRKRDAQTDAEIVEEAAAVGVAVVMSHRRDITQARGICGMLMSELRDGTEHRVLLGEIISQQADDDDWPDKAREAASRAISLPARAGIVRDLSNALKTLVTLERKAYSIDENKQTERDTLDEILEAVTDTSRGIDGYGD